MTLWDHVRPFLPVVGAATAFRGALELQGSELLRFSLVVLGVVLILTTLVELAQEGEDR